MRPRLATGLPLSLDVYAEYPPSKGEHNPQMNQICIKNY
jgi:hypothetical protein